MSFTDTLIPRLRAKGVNVTDLRSDLPRNGTYDVRPLSWNQYIVDHYEGVDNDGTGNPIDRMRSEAQYHIDKDWGGGAHGDGLMYHMVCDRNGNLYMTRNLEDWLWHCGNPNAKSMAYQNHGGPDQRPTQQQAATYQKVHDTLCFDCPEFPASQQNVYGHKEMAQFGGTATDCPGQFLPLTVDYRTKKNVNPGQYASGGGPQGDIQLPPQAPIQAVQAEAVIIPVRKVFAPFTVNLSPSQTQKADVEAMQRYLVNKGCATESMFDGMWGYYGSHTQVAVHTFQTKKGITGTSRYGWWYDDTRAKANQDLAYN